MIEFLVLCKFLFQALFVLVVEMGVWGVGVGVGVSTWLSMPLCSYRKYPSILHFVGDVVAWSRGPGFDPWPAHCVVFLGKALSQYLSTLEYGYRQTVRESWRNAGG